MTAAHDPNVDPPAWRTRLGRLHPALGLAAALWLAAGLAITGRTLLQPVKHTVFPVFAASAAHWWADQPLYGDYSPLDRFRYPPAFAVAVSPLAFLGLRAGGILWSWLSLLVYGAGLWRLRRDVLPGDWSPPLTAAFLVLALFGALRGLWNAQSNALAVGLLLLAASAVARRRWGAGASFLAAAVWLKLTPLAVALLLCALWPRRLAGRFALALAAGALLPLLTRPPATVLGHYREWAADLAGSSSGRWPGFRDAWTVWLAVRHALDGAAGPFPLHEPLDSLPYRALQLSAAAACLAWCLWQRRRGLGHRQAVLLTLGMGMAWLMLFGPAVEHATYVFLAPVLAWAVLDPRAWPTGRLLIRTAAVLVLVLGWGALTRPLHHAFPLVLTALPVGTALAAAWLAGYAAALRLEAPPYPRLLPFRAPERFPRERVRPRSRAA